MPTRSDRNDELKRAHGFGVAGFNKKDRSITFECWSRFSKVSEGDQAQFLGWPVTFKMTQNDGRKVKGWLPKLTFTQPKQVVQVINEKTKEISYTVRVKGRNFQPKVYENGNYSVKFGSDQTNKFALQNVPSSAKVKAAGSKKINL